ncbi:MAG: hypothetical protein FIA99_14180 [Ruminiclostridium sp.]|nr:hypothetical protein [Ruminiclostridium sp.]
MMALAIHAMEKNNNGGAMVSLQALDKKTGVRIYGNRGKTEITETTTDKTADITARNTDLAFTEKLKGDLLSIRE